MNYAPKIDILNMSIIRSADKSDVDALSSLANLCFTDTFGHLYSKDNLSKHLTETCSPEFFCNALINDKIIIIENNYTLIGYIKFGDMDLAIEPIPALSKEIHRLYIHPDFQKKGFGRKLIQEAFNDPILKNAKHYYLSVYENNISAQKFYKGYGFSIIGEYNYYVGTHIDREFIMHKQHGQENE